MKSQDFVINLNKFADYLEDENSSNRILQGKNDTDQQLREQILEDINSLGADNWKKIYLWCRDSEQISQFHTDMAHTIGRKVRDEISLSARELYAAHLLLEEIAKKSTLLQTIFENSESN